MSLQDQIRARWGRYGDWGAADQDQTAALASILQANGIEDLSKLSFRDYSYTAPGQFHGGDAGDGGFDAPTTFSQIQALYDGKPLGFLGNVEGDGSITPMGANWQAGDAVNRGDAHAIAWNGQGHGSTSFAPFKAADGSYGLAPVWGSSRQQTYDDLRGIASILTLAAGGYYAGAGGTTGAVANGALQGYGTAVAGNMLANPDGDVNSLSKASLAGAATGALSGGIKAYGADQGWSNATTKAVQGGANAAIRGGSGEDILKGAVMSGGQGLLGGLTDGMKGQGAGLGGMKAMDFNWDGSYGGGNFVDSWSGLPYSSDTVDNGLFDFSGYTLSDLNGTPYEFNAGTDWKGLGSLALKMLNGGDNKGLAALLPLLGAGLGAAGDRDSSITSNKDAWAPAQTFAKGLLDYGQGLATRLQAQPFSQAQQTAYGNTGGLLDSINRAAPSVLAGMQLNAGGHNQIVRGQPTRLKTYDVQGFDWQPQSVGNFGAG